jgi:glucosamine kinase
MILIADSGGSKTDWRFIDKNGQVSQASAPGFNPYYQPVDDLKKSVKEIIIPKVKDSVSKIFFYGAGVSSLKNQLTIKNAFLEFFHEAQI